MTQPPRSGAAEPLREGKYARIERERRFLLSEAPPDPAGRTARTITDRYLTGTRLRLRRITHEDTGEGEYKLTQKVPAYRSGATQGLITTIYLNQQEYELVASLSAAVLSKTRLSVPPMGVDVFHGPLKGLILAEAEFTDDEAAAGFVPPPYCVAEVTDDVRFTGGHLAHTGHAELLAHLAQFGIPPAAVT